MLTPLNIDKCFTHSVCKISNGFILTSLAKLFLFIVVVVGDTIVRSSFHSNWVTCSVKVSGICTRPTVIKWANWHIKSKFITQLIIYPVDESLFTTKGFRKNVKYGRKLMETVRLANQDAHELPKRSHFYDPVSSCKRVFHLCTFNVKHRLKIVLRRHLESGMRPNLVFPTLCL